MKHSALNIACGVLLLSSVLTQQVGAQTATTSPDYSAGMSAYMNNDFEAARSYWQQAAAANDGRAMFNLGLLHERKRVAGASQELADQWFSKSGEAGYAAADYHLALRLQARGQDNDANQLLHRAADAGFILAREQLGLKPVSPPVVSDISAPSGISISTKPEGSTLIAPAQGNTSEADHRGYNRESWILEQMPSDWTIQMLAFSDEAKVRDFIDDHGLHRNAAYFAEKREDAIIYKLIYGAYPNKEAANSARSGFTAALREHGPWLRPIQAVQSVINER